MVKALRCHVGSWITLIDRQGAFDPDATFGASLGIVTTSHSIWGYAAMFELLDVLSLF